MDICVFGDSIAWGACDPVNGGWVEQLRHYIWLQDKSSHIYNLGISGNTTTDILGRIEVEAEWRAPKVIIFAVGINDAQFIRPTNSHRISDDDFRDNLHRLYTIAKKYTRKIVFVGLTAVDESKVSPIPWNTDKTYENKNIQRLGRIIQEFCAENDLKFIPMNDLLDNSDLYDGAHPNTQGHAKMFEIIKSEIKKIIDTPS
jgi:lysophospholipase L1-like esterase